MQTSAVPTLAAAMIGECAKKGFCSSYGEQHPDYLAVGVPLGHTIDGEMIVFNSVAPLRLASRDSIETGFGPRLVAMAQQLREAARLTSR